MSQVKLSIVLPAKNEAASLSTLLPSLRSEFPDAEIIVVDDGSKDETASICKAHGIVVKRHHYSKGNGAAIKAGARAARGEYIAFMDADGQHTAQSLRRLIESHSLEYDMIVGARTSDSQASIFRHVANTVYNKLSSWMVGHRIEDLTSGIRVIEATKFRQFIHLLPNGFSYPTTITMAFFRAGYSVAYVPIKVEERIGKSHIRLVHDGFRFLIIIFKIGTLYSPLKLFTPISLFFTMAGLINYAHTFFERAAFTNMSALMLITGVLVFLIGLVSEQITTLIFMESNTVTPPNSENHNHYDEKNE